MSNNKIPLAPYNGGYGSYFISRIGIDKLFAYDGTYTNEKCEKDWSLSRKIWSIKMIEDSTKVVVTPIGLPKFFMEQEDLRFDQLDRTLRALRKLN